ncbi:DUF3093 domain-containing protein [Georgenia sp. TF02-10]|uniref:DUF3093 domain-containing protein n=1 Tax=Georgenia sp. TF02-10 TaxID=2917725 RepID=UPI001FA6EA33|nr:DUF3093 domain-containing protein [Georgenia sp. TF02-10]UNX53383.1 DUF3093 domain-containing protein [Georgenia sp. TF02-10]
MTTRYTERLLPGPGGLVVVALAGLACGVLALPIGGGAAALVVGVLGTLAVGAIVALSSPVVAVVAGGDPADGGQAEELRLRAGGAVIPVGALGPGEVLDAEGLRQALGVSADARDWVCQRPWVRSAVRLPVTDPRDATPSWVVCTRRPAQLLAALDRR